MKIKKTFAKNILTLSVAIALSVTTMQTSASEVSHDISWVGKKGYTASGYFSYDNKNSGVTIIGPELSNFYLQGFDPQGNPVGEFRFDDIGKEGSIFYFTYDSIGERILMAGQPDPNVEHDLEAKGSSQYIGFAAAVGLSSNSTQSNSFSLISRRGCEWQDFRSEIDMYLGSTGQGICSGADDAILVDTGLDSSGMAVTPTIPPQSSYSHSIEISISEYQDPIYAEGGKLHYSAIISNLDINENNMVKWSILTFPTGQDFSVHKAKRVTINGEDVREYTRPYITIKDWFPAGEYSFSWYVADPDNTDQKIVVDTFTFEKLDN
jgi:hypothetical protein